MDDRTWTIVLVSYPHDVCPSTAQLHRGGAALGPHRSAYRMAARIWRSGHAPICGCRRRRSACSILKTNINHPYTTFAPNQAVDLVLVVWGFTARATQPLPTQQASTMSLCHGVTPGFRRNKHKRQTRYASRFHDCPDTPDTPYITPLGRKSVKWAAHSMQAGRTRYALGSSCAIPEPRKTPLLLVFLLCLFSLTVILVQLLERQRQHSTATWVNLGQNSTATPRRVENRIL